MVPNRVQRIIFIVGDNQLISTLQNFAAPLFKWFSDNQRKANPGKCHLIIIKVAKRKFQLLATLQKIVTVKNY